MKRTPERNGKPRGAVRRGVLVVITLLTLGLYGLGIWALASPPPGQGDASLTSPLVKPIPILMPTPTQEPLPPAWEPYFITEPMPSDQEDEGLPKPPRRTPSPGATPLTKTPTPRRTTTPSPRPTLSLTPRTSPTPARATPTRPPPLPTPTPTSTPQPGRR